MRLFFACHLQHNAFPLMSIRDMLCVQTLADGFNMSDPNVTEFSVHYEQGDSCPTQGGSSDGGAPTRRRAVATYQCSEAVTSLRSGMVCRKQQDCTPGRTVSHS